MANRQPEHSLTVSTSFEELLISGGDSRMHLTTQGGLNKYGCAPRVRDVVSLGSCTASSLDPVGLEGALAAHERVLAADARDESRTATADTIFGELRARLRDVFGLEESACDVVFCPSGTDAEMLALQLARGASDAPFMNIVTGPSEVGSGTINAAAGKHFNRHVPCGDARVPGEPIDDELGHNVRVETIRLRAADGLQNPTAELDDRARRLVAQARAEGARVMLHIVTHSKTGVYAPSFDTAAELRETHGDAVTVMLDAAQGRLSPRSIRAAVDLGYIVLVTGSKFYGGPPFSGALLIPPALSPAKTGLDHLSAGMRDYFTATELPQEWTSLRQSLPAEPNVGLLLRWCAAMDQIERYHATPKRGRRAVMKAFELAVPRILSESRHVRVVPVAPIRDADSPRSLEAATTVFPFFVYGADGESLERDELKHLFRLINSDLSQFSKDASNAVADVDGVLSRCLHIGQPVLLSGLADDEHSVLRVALGAPLVFRLAEDTTLGETFEDRLEWLERQLITLRDKLDLIVDNLDSFEGAQ